MQDVNRVRRLIESTGETADDDEGKNATKGHDALDVDDGFDAFAKVRLVLVVIVGDVAALCFDLYTVVRAERNERT